MPFGSVWIAVVASAVAVFVGSSILHMALQYHKADYKKLENEDPVRDALRKAATGPGLYFTPYCSDHRQMKDPAMQEKFRQGPVAMITVAPSGNISMGRNLGLWFLFSVLVSFVSAYVARVTLHPGSDGMTVMRVTGTVAFAAYGLSHVSDSIWKAQPWSNTVRSLIDALVYSVITALVFKALWPAA
jgi:hypothetical protein